MPSLVGSEMCIRDRLNTIISAKLGVAIDTDSSNDDSHKVA